jgi:hypothetical protein
MLVNDSSIAVTCGQVARTSNKKTRTQHVVIQLQHRLNRFEKQMQLLFDKTVSPSLVCFVCCVCLLLLFFLIRNS